MPENYLVEGPITSMILSSYLESLALRTDTGGHSFFLGQVRADIIKGKKVSAIEYSAYENMVKAEAENIKKRILSEFDDVKSITIIHSSGLVKVGEISLAVMISAGHRQQALEACSMTVELIKQKLPVWKKEILEDNTHSWKENE
jgi:molybdopterin synthase catalytic subunit